MFCFFACKIKFVEKLGGGVEKLGGLGQKIG